MEEESWRRNPQGGMIEQESQRSNAGERILKKSSRKRNPGGGTLEEKSWMRNPKGGILDVGSWGRNPGTGILREDSLGRNPRGENLEEESWKQEPRRALGPPPDSPGRTSRDPLEPPRISLQLPGPLSGLRGKVCRKPYVFLRKVARPSFSPARERGDTHQVPRLRIKFACVFCGRDHHHAKACVTNTARTIIVKAIWGNLY